MCSYGVLRDYIKSKVHPKLHGATLLWSHTKLTVNNTWNKYGKYNHTAVYVSR